MVLRRCFGDTMTADGIIMLVVSTSTVAGALGTLLVALSFPCCCTGCGGAAMMCFRRLEPVYDSGAE